MRSLYKEKEALAFKKKYAGFPEELALLVYTSRLLGQNPGLVLHGGGNTSVKLRQTNIVGEENDVIFVKGSGQDLSVIEPEGFTGLNLHPLLKLRQLESISDIEMENQLYIHRISSRSPDPSVEALLHAFLPHKYVHHTHADSILILTNQTDGEAMIREALGLKVVVLPYVRSGFPLAKIAADGYEKNPDTDAIIILNHGIFTFSDNVRTAYEIMVDYVGRAEAFIEDCLQTKTTMASPVELSCPENFPTFLARCAQVIRGACARPGSDGKIRRFYVETRTAQDVVAASLAEEAPMLCTTGVLTPDHAIRTKNHMAHIERIPETDEDLKQVVKELIERFKTDYDFYFRACSKEADIDPSAVDPYPVLFLVRGLGLMAVGGSRQQAMVAADIGERTIRAKLCSSAMGSYVPIPETHVFDMEYWNLQQKKLDKSTLLPLQGQVAVITGAGGAIGYGVADRLLAAGAVVVISDIDEKRLQNVYDILADKYDPCLIEHILVDVTNLKAVEDAYGEISRRLGGIDIVVPNAGIAHVATIEYLTPEKLDQVMSVNFKGTFTVIKASIPIFKRQGTGGNIVVISSKNVFDPGAAFGAYSASKASAHQIAKIAALELAEIGVRVNMVNPDAVFGDENVCSNLWEEIGPERMKSRGLDAEGLKEYYCQRSLLKSRVLAEHVGNAVVFFASDLTPTTGAALPVDAGNPATFSR
jgi:rhamnose utilization protein RhaD (predicted bifunctional aldolase and dehydrogenase)/NAD(P)-dependent dehydrogenase (short-subunit alcohol dehydrogenase family)